MRKIFLILLLLVFVVGCAPKEAPQEKVQEQAQEEQTVEKASEETPEKLPVEEKPMQLKDVEIAEKSPDVFYSTQTECEAVGGIWEKTATGANICNLKLPDSGKVCTDTIECNGICVGDTIEATIGRCSETQYLHGCIFYLEGGHVLGTICFD